MRFSDVIAASLVAPLVAAHGGLEGAPRVFGMPKQLRARNPFAALEIPHDAQTYKSLHARQSTDGRCGPQGGNQRCAANECCSGAGYCGTTKDHCQAPDCLINFGPACDANKTPNGETTRNDPRPKLGNIEYGGGGIYACNKPNTVAITYDDGPYIYTEGVLDLFKARGAKATFFVTGNNIGKGAIDENWSGVISRMVAEGHQVASHTWSHQDLSAITEEQVYDQMVKNEMAIRNILGKYPTYMRPPYSSCTETCQSVMEKLGYVISYFDLDTDDYNQLTTEKIEVAKGNFKTGIDTRGSDGDRLAIAHDIHQLTAVDLTKYMLDYLYAQGLTAVTMGECLNDPEANWYRSSTPAPPTVTSRSSSAPVPTPTGPTSQDGSCGGSAGFSCIGFVGNDGLLGECCSTHGYCGRTSDYCDTGCQAGFGKCGAQPSASPPASVSTTATGPVPTPTGPTSQDGSCGGSAGFSCIGFVGNDGLLGECCSTHGYCGHTSDYCGTGCQAGFGKCGTQGSSSSASSSSVHASSSHVPSSSVHAPSSSVHISSSHVSTAPSATPTTSGEKSRDGSCGGEKGYTCVGFSTLEGVKSECCSEYGWCGSSPDHCGPKCNPIYGNCPGSTSSASVSSKHDASSSIAPASSSVHASSVHSVSASASGSASASVSHASSTGVYPTPTPSVSKDSYPSGSSTIYPSGSSAVYPTGSSAIYPSGTSAVYPSGSSAVYPPGSSVGYPSGTSAVYPASSAPVYPASSAPVYPASSAPVYPASSAPVYVASSAPIYAASSFSTAVKPTSTPCKTSTAVPSPTPKVSKDGKCGSANGGQTCAGYKNALGIQIECCCKESGKCSVDPWACGVGCDKGYGKCWL